tara:strand:- start:849 stop:1535 length:687 start_codon:yes stop_codon:yes gene_type:complete
VSLEVWCVPDAQHAYVLGVDTAEGLGHGDYSCIQALDVNTGEQVAVWHGHIPPDELAEEILSMGLWYRDALCCVESNNHGLTTLTVLRQLGYPNLFRKRTLNKTTNKITQEFGWRTTRTSKPLLIDDLSTALRTDELTIFDESTVAELRTFVRNERGAMAGSPFDDRVIALALANEMRKYAFAPEFVQKVDDYWTVDWFRRLAERDTRGEDPYQIGVGSMRGTPPHGL